MEGMRCGAPKAWRLVEAMCGALGELRPPRAARATASLTRGGLAVSPASASVPAAPAAPGHRVTERGVASGRAGVSGRVSCSGSSLQVSSRVTEVARNVNQYHIFTVEIYPDCGILMLS